MAGVPTYALTILGAGPVNMLPVCCTEGFTTEILRVMTTSVMIAVLAGRIDKAYKCLAARPLDNSQAGRIFYDLSGVGRAAIMQMHKHSALFSSTLNDSALLVKWGARLGRREGR